MYGPIDPTNLVGMMSEVAASASERLVPRPFRGMVDRTLVDVACAAGGGLAPVAEHLCPRSSGPASPRSPCGRNSRASSATSARPEGHSPMKFG